MYGGTFVTSVSSDITTFDSYFPTGATSILQEWMERLTSPSWTMDPAVYNYGTDFVPADYVVGYLATGWEFSDANTIVYHLRQGIHWQNLPPVNGREFTSADVVYHYGRMFGLGINSKPSPYNSTVPAYTPLKSVKAIDKYTVAFGWSGVSQEYILEQMDQYGGEHAIEAQEAVTQWGDLADWHHAIGTGPWILTDLVSGSSATMIRNPTYWGYDERYPQNQLPYISIFKYLIIPNANTVLAAVRTGKIDNCGLTFVQYQGMLQTNPELKFLSSPGGNLTIDPRSDVKPFSDVRVRQAMQEAIDMKTIAATLFSGHAHSDPTSLTSYKLAGWGWPYPDWPQDLKDIYAYNPTAAKAKLAAAGYANGFNTDVIANSTANQDLLAVIQSEFATIGINMSIQLMDNTSWNSYVRGRSHDAIAYPSGASIGLSFIPSRQLQRFQTGYPVNWCAVSDPVYDGYVAAAQSGVTVDDIKKALKDANVYVAQHLWIISLPGADGFSCYQPWLGGFSNQPFALGSLALLGGFYTSRYWINGDLKKQLGH
jgi:peptide/nickel transport system substrate-binding protein